MFEAQQRKQQEEQAKREEEEAKQIETNRENRVNVADISKQEDVDIDDI